ncbi:MAG TPA: glycine zipper 2TM domain-containing protein [Burkholderiaceae bacterium]|nr:glycine zipper 2TM domain-containing protein [Burkholderiaceae bacterium]
MNLTLSTLALGALLASAGFAQAASYATVISTTPVTATVAVPQQICDDGLQQVRAAPTGAGAVIGAIVGGVIGHGFGGGFGQAAATGIGAVAGATIGGQVEANATQVSTVPVRRCRSVSSYREQVIGYDVEYEYAGQRYSTRMAQDPGTRLAIDVRPRQGGAVAAAPLQSAPAPVPAAPAHPPAYVSAYPQTVYRSAYPPLYAPAYAPVRVRAPQLIYVSPIAYFDFGYSSGQRGHRGHGHHDHQRHWR